MRKLLGLAGVVALAAGGAGMQARAAEPPGDAVSVSFADGFEQAGATPRAKAGTALAAKRGLSRRQLKARLAEAMRSAGGRSGAWVYDMDAGRRRTLFWRNARERLLLASNTKLFTTAAFLGRFGYQRRLATGLWARGRRSGRDERRLRGKLVLVGDGDPALAEPDFARRHGLPLTPIRPLARAVERAGIKIVDGDIKADPSIFDGAKSVPQTGITGGPYLSTLSGLSYDSGYDGGRYASSPPRVAGRALKRALRRIGVRVTGRVRVGNARQRLLERRPLARVRSPRAAALIKATNKPSNNFFAEMLLKRLAAGPRRQGTTQAGARLAERFAKRAGSSVSMENGSGLSRRNRASARKTGRLLVHMARDAEQARFFRDSLAVAGRDGTLAERMRGTAAEGRCQAKTGTINYVSVLSGYCAAGRGGTVVFSILMNGVDVGAARRAQDRMVAAIARYG